MEVANPMRQEVSIYRTGEQVRRLCGTGAGTEDREREGKMVGTAWCCPPWKSQDTYRCCQTTGDRKEPKGKGEGGIQWCLSQWSAQQQMMRPQGTRLQGMCDPVVLLSLAVTTHVWMLSKDRGLEGIQKGKGDPAVLSGLLTFLQEVTNVAAAQ